MTNEGFAFNEGWAEYWSKEPQHGNVCDKTPPIFSIEGVVAEDLNYLANCTGVDRKGMIAVLQRGRNIIHTDKEFREEFQKQFPNIDLTKCPPLSPARALLIPRERLKTLRDLRYGIPASSSSGAIAAGSSAASVRQPVDNATLVAALRADMDAQVQVTNQLRKDLDDSIKVAAEPGVCPAVSCELVAERVVRPDRLRGAIELSEQLQRRMEADLATLHSGDRSGPQFPKDFEAMRLATKITFESERKEIVKRSLDRAINALAPLVARDTTGALAEQSGQLARQVRLLEMRTPTNDAYLTFLKLPRSARDDGLELATAAHSQWSVKRIVLIVALVLLGILLLSVLVWLTKRLSA